MSYLDYLRDLHRGNPWGLYFIGGIVVFCALALILTPLTDERFDEQMEQVESRPDEVEFRRRYPLNDTEVDLEELERMYQLEAK